MQGDSCYKCGCGLKGKLIEDNGCLSGLCTAEIKIVNLGDGSTKDVCKDGILRYTEYRKKGVKSS